MLTIKDLDNYYFELKQILDSGKPAIKPNRDRAHNSTVQSLMLDTSKVIRMYCGQLSVLRSEFYNVISKESPELSENLKSKIINSFTEFLNKEDSSLTIIFENFDNKYFDDLIIKNQFTNGLEKGKIHLYKLMDDLDIKRSVNHFSLSDNSIVRFEQDKEQRSAICMLNLDKSVDIFLKIYDRLLKIAKPIKDEEFVKEHEQ